MPVKNTWATLLAAIAILSFIACDDSSRGSMVNTITVNTGPLDTNFVTGTGDADTDGDADSDADGDADGDADTTFVPGDSRLDAINQACGGLMPAKITGGQQGWGSRYWDCCKPSCAWIDNVNNNKSLLAKNCDINDVEVPAFQTIEHQYWTEEVSMPSGCDNEAGAYTCYDNAPFAVCDQLAYGFAAVPSSEPACGKCFQLDFDGGFQHGTPKAAHKAMAGKTMIVMASNIGGDVGSGQFDIMIPGGGFGMFTAGCERQWGVNPQDATLVGANQGGLSTQCFNELPGGEDAPMEDIKDCVRTKCNNLFGNDPAKKYLFEGCIFYADWMNAVNNPTFSYKEVPCPQALKDLYGTSF